MEPAELARLYPSLAPETPQPHADPAMQVYTHPTSRAQLRSEPAELQPSEFTQEQEAAARKYYPTTWPQPEPQKSGEQAKPADETAEGAGDSAALFPDWDAAATQARESGDTQTADRIDEAKGVVTQLFADYGVEPAEQSQITAILREQPAERTEAEIQAMHTVAMADLQRAWGDETARKVAIAQRVAKEAIERAQWLEDMLDSGVGNDVRLVRLFAAIGERRGYA